MVKVSLSDGRSCYYDGRALKLLDFFIEACKYHNTSAMFVYDGFSGLGKSTLAISHGFYCDRSKSGFGLHKIFFDSDSFLEGLDNAEAYSFLLFDEAMVLSNRSSMSKLNITMVKAMSMIRSKKIIVGFCINAIFDLDKNLALSRANVLFHVYGKNLIDRGNFAAFFKGRDGHNKISQLFLLGKKNYSYSRPYSNFIGRFTRRFLVDPKEYERLKQIGVSKALRERIPPRIEQIKNALIFNCWKDLGITQKRISELAECSEVTIDRAIRKYKEEQVLKAL